MLKLLDELRNMQAVDECMVHVDRYWHRTASVCFGNLAEGDAWCGIFTGEVARMRDRGEVEPGKNRITDHVDLWKALDVISLPYPIQFYGRLANEVSNSWPEPIMSETNGAVRSSHSAAAMNLFIAPDTSFDDACPEVLNSVRSYE